jgi:hypothetical protein
MPQSFYCRQSTMTCVIAKHKTMWSMGRLRRREDRIRRACRITGLLAWGFWEMLRGYACGTG